VLGTIKRHLVAAIPPLRAAATELQRLRKREAELNQSCLEARAEVARLQSKIAAPGKDHELVLDDLPIFQHAPFLEMPIDAPANEIADRFRRWGTLLLRGSECDAEIVRNYCSGIAAQSLLSGVGATADGVAFLETEPFTLPVHRRVLNAVRGPLRALFGGNGHLMSMAAISGSYRRVSASTTNAHIPWHQDHGPVGLPRMMTCWTLLFPEACGSDSPGVEFIVQRDRGAFIPHKLHSTGYQFVESVPVFAGDFRWQPIVRIGDILVFDGYTPHRSFATETMTQYRVSTDFRFSDFDAAIAHSLLVHKHAPVIATDDGVFGPIRRADNAFGYEFGHAEGNDQLCEELFDSAVKWRAPSQTSANRS
jgi:hypothetical protein